MHISGALCAQCRLIVPSSGGGTVLHITPGQSLCSYSETTYGSTSTLIKFLAFSTESPISMMPPNELQGNAESTIPHVGQLMLACFYQNEDVTNW